METSSCWSLETPIAAARLLTFHPFGRNGDFLQLVYGINLRVDYGNSILVVDGDSILVVDGDSRLVVCGNPLLDVYGTSSGCRVETLF